MTIIYMLYDNKQSITENAEMPTMKFFRHFLLLLLLAAPALAFAQVSFPNGVPDISVEDLAVKDLGGRVSVDRQWWEGQWRINLRWADAVMGGAGYGSLDCLNYPLMTIQGRTYKKNDSQNVWALEFRYSVSATEYFEGEGCLAKRIRKLRWFDNMSKNWMEYERTDPGVLSFRLVRFGDRNDNSVSLVHDADGKLTEVRDRFDNPVLSYVYTNGQLTEIRDVPVNGEAARAVKYGWGSSVVDGKSVPVITQVTDVLGNVTSYTVQNGKLTGVTDPEGRTRKYAYTSDRVTSYTDGLGNVTTYVYDYDRMKQEFYVRIKSPDGVQTENWYDNEGVLIWRMVAGQTLYKRGKVDPVSRTEIRIDGAGRETKITRDEFRNLTKTEYPDGSITSAKYSVQHGRVSEETDELGVKTNYEYDAKGNLLKLTEAVGTADERITEYAVDQYGQRIRETRKGRIEADGTETPDASWSYEYDNYGNRTKTTDPLGNVTSSTYNRQGLLLTQTDAAGKVWSQSYDAAGRRVSTKNPLDEESRYVYDKNGNLIRQTDPLGKVWQIAYDQNNRETAQTNPLGETSTRQYDARGRVISETDAADNKLYAFAYDAHGNLTETTDAAGNVTRTHYALTGALTQIDYFGFSSRFTFDRRGRVTRTEEVTADVTRARQSIYDRKGQAVQETDALGQSNSLAYDNLGRLIQVTDPQGGITRFAYDRNDNLIAVTDANGNVTRYVYDALGRRIREIRPLGQTTQYQYNITGQLTQIIDAQGNRISYAYDVAGRRIGETHISSAGTITRSITYTYDQSNRLIGYTDHNTGHADHLAHSAAYTLDALVRKTKETLVYGDQTYTQEMAWGADGRMASQRLADGTTLTYEWHGGQLKSISLPDDSQINITERWWNLPTLTHYPGEVAETRTHDGFGRLTKQQVKAQDQNTLLQRALTYDLANNPTRIDTERGRNDYIYDPLYRLVQVKTNISGMPNEGYSYDPVGNRLTDSRRPNPGQGDKSWTYNANNQLEASATEDTGIIFSNSQTVIHSYDENGSLIEKHTSSGTEAQFSTENQRYQYDAQNRLTEVRDHEDNLIASYQYDPFGRRIRKTVYREWNAGWQELDEPQIHTYLYSDTGLSAEYRQIGEDAEPELVAQYGWQPDGMWGTNPVWIRTQRQGNNSGEAEDNEFFYYQNDHLGTPQQVIDGQGKIVWKQKATAFGETTVDPASTITNNLRFPGQYYDKETNTHYNYFRDYNPTIGRYVQSDPIGLEGGINLYAYVDGNPMRYVDPEGLQVSDSVMCRNAGLSASWCKDKPDKTPCVYYQQVCKEVGCKYHCNAYNICMWDWTIDSIGANFLLEGICFASTKQVNCIRRCLVSEDKKARKNPECQKDTPPCDENGGGKCTKKKCIDDYHNKCFTQCGVGWDAPHYGNTCYGGNTGYRYTNDGD